MNIESCLEAQSWHTLRAIAKVRRWPFDSNLTKEEAVARLSTTLITPASLQLAWENLSPEARAALRALLDAGGEMPFATAVAHFGEIRPARQVLAQMRSTHTFTPLSPAEELLYHGLAFPVNLGTRQRPLWTLILPTDIQSLLSPLFASPLLSPPSPVSPLLSPLSPLLPQVFAFLSFLNREEIRPLHGRWLPPGAISRLIPHLGIPTPESPVRHERQVPRVAFLHYLAERAGLVTVTAGCLKPSLPAHTWLHASAADRLRTLWQAWREQNQDNVALWQRYRLPGHRDDDPPARFNGLLKHLAACPPGQPYPLPDFLATLAERDPALFRPQAPYRLWAALDEEERTAFQEQVRHWLSDLLTGPLAWFGVVDVGRVRHSLPDGHLQTCSFALTPLGAALLGREDGLWPQDPSPAPLAIRVEEKQEEEREPVIVLTAPPGFPLPDRLALEELVPPDPQAPGVYRLTREGVLRALQRGHTVDGLLRQLERDAGDALLPTVVGTLYRWAEEHGQVVIRPALLLQVRDPSLLRELSRVRRIREKFGQTLSARAVTVDASRLEALVRQLEQRGLYPVVERPPQPGAAEPALAPGDRASLVAALRVHELVAQRLGLKVRLPFPLLDDWTAALSQAERDAVERLVDEVRRGLDDLERAREFEDRPPFPVAPLLPLLEEAIARQATVEIEYHPVGRPPGVRRVDPLRLEERGRTGVHYLIAFCHLRGEVRTFRVDRIASLHIP